MKMCLRSNLVVLVALWLVAGLGVDGAFAQGTAFSYQGQLRQNSSPVNAMCDFEFHLYNAETDGLEIGTVQSATNVSVSNGLFTTEVDFGAEAFNGNDRWLEIGVRCPSGSGSFATLDPRQALTRAPYAISAPAAARDGAGIRRADLGITTGGAGFGRTNGPNGNLNLLLSTFSDAPDNGFIGVYNADGDERAAMGIGSSSDAAFARTRGANGNLNVLIGSLTDFPNNGFVSVHDENGDSQAGIFVTAEGMGRVFGDEKNFVVDHPNRPGFKIMYTSLEGPEAAIYHRGVVTLDGGRATIDLPEHFTTLADPGTITVQLTPGSFDSQGLAAASVRDGRIEIGELHKGRGSYDVYFLVHALRRGHEKSTPVLSAEEFRAQFDHVAAATVNDLPHAPTSAQGFTVSAVAQASGNSGE